MLRCLWLGGDRLSLWLMSSISLCFLCNGYLHVIQQLLWFCFEKNCKTPQNLNNAHTPNFTPNTLIHNKRHLEGLRGIHFTLNSAMLHIVSVFPLSIPPLLSLPQFQPFFTLVGSPISKVCVQATFQSLNILSLPHFFQSTLGSSRESLPKVPRFVNSHHTPHLRSY